MPKTITIRVIRRFWFFYFFEVVNDGDISRRTTLLPQELGYGGVEIYRDGDLIDAGKVELDPAGEPKAVLSGFFKTYPRDKADDLLCLDAEHFHKGDTIVACPKNQN